MPNLTDEQRAAFSHEIADAIERKEYQTACRTIEQAAMEDGCEPAAILSSYVIGVVISANPAAADHMEGFLNYLCTEGSQHLVAATTLN
jgi:alkylhydroperoxidase/carboxymuconolactone decarboxylase family protein YurZ